MTGAAGSQAVRAPATVPHVGILGPEIGQLGESEPAQLAGERVRLEERDPRLAQAVEVRLERGPYGGRPIARRGVREHDLAAGGEPSRPGERAQHRVALQVDRDAEP